MTPDSDKVSHKVRMPALHPPFSGAPLSCVVLLLVVEAMILVPRVRSMALLVRPFMVVSCVAAVIGAFLSGYQASSAVGTLSPEVEAVLATHHLLGRFLLITVGLLGTFFFLHRVAKRGHRVLLVMYYIALVAQVLLTLRIGALGGALVFDHGVGVATTATRR